MSGNKQNSESDNFWELENLEEVTEEQEVWICDGVPKDGKVYQDCGDPHRPYENFGLRCVICDLPRNALLSTEEIQHPAVLPQAVETQRTGFSIKSIFIASIVLSILIKIVDLLESSIVYLFNFLIINLRDLLTNSDTHQITVLAAVWIISILIFIIKFRARQNGNRVSRNEVKIWRLGDRMIALSSGGAFLGGLIDQLPGAIFGAVIGAALGLFMKVEGN